MNDTSILELLVSAASEIVQSPVDPSLSLVAQNLDSLGAVDLLEVLQRHGHDANYDDLLSEVSIETLVASVRLKIDDGPIPALPEVLDKPVDLTGPQSIWADLEKQGWADWANISLCMSIPATTISAAYLPAILQTLCDTNDAMRMVLVEPRRDKDPIQQRCISGFQLPIKVTVAPPQTRDALHLIELFEGVTVSPFGPSTRAMVLSSATNEGRHWVCITMHHVFCDRISMQSLAHQFKALLASGSFHIAQRADIGFTDYAIWCRKRADDAKMRQSQDDFLKHLANADTASCRPVLQLVDEDLVDLGANPNGEALRPAENTALRALSRQLNTTLPMLLQTVFSALVARLTGDDQALGGKSDLLSCHVTSNRERHASLRNLVGCFDTSVPVVVRLTETAKLETLCLHNRQAFAAANAFVSDLARGGWVSQHAADSALTPSEALIERVPHINIIRTPRESDGGTCELGIQVHPVRRVQKTRWGLLLRVTLPPSDNDRTGEMASESAQADGITIQAFAEHRALANATQHCFVDLLRDLLKCPVESAGELRVLDLVNGVVDRARFSAAQVRHAAALVPKTPPTDAFIYEKLIARQQRWYQHNDRFELVT